MSGELLYDSLCAACGSQPVRMVCGVCSTADTAQQIADLTTEYGLALAEAEAVNLGHEGYIAGLTARLEAAEQRVVATEGECREYLVAARTAERERDNWQESARVCCGNSDYWRERAETAEQRAGRLVTAGDTLHGQTQGRAVGYHMAGHHRRIITECDDPSCIAWVAALKAWEGARNG
jgi:hypothetical protein